MMVYISPLIIPRDVSKKVQLYLATLYVLVSDGSVLDSPSGLRVALCLYSTAVPTLLFLISLHGFQLNVVAIIH